jgi:hypothetical protein
MTDNAAETNAPTVERAKEWGGMLRHANEIGDPITLNLVVGSSPWTVEGDKRPGGAHAEAPRSVNPRVPVREYTTGDVIKVEVDPYAKEDDKRYKFYGVEAPRNKILAAQFQGDVFVSSLTPEEAQRLTATDSTQVDISSNELMQQWTQKEEGRLHPQIAGEAPTKPPFLHRAAYHLGVKITPEMDAWNKSERQRKLQEAENARRAKIGDLKVQLDAAKAAKHGLTTEQVEDYQAQQVAARTAAAKAEHDQIMAGAVLTPLKDAGVMDGTGGIKTAQRTIKEVKAAGTLK